MHTAVPQAIGSIPDCSSDLYIAGRPCVDFVWTPSNDTALAVRMWAGLREGGGSDRSKGEWPHEALKQACTDGDLIVLWRCEHWAFA